MKVGNMSNQINDTLLDTAREIKDELGDNHYISLYIDKDIECNDLEGLAQHVKEGQDEIYKAIKLDRMMEHYYDVKGEMESEDIY
jgi:hypothetical protein